MLKQTVIEKLKGFGLDVDKLSAAIKAPGEVDFELPDMVVMQVTELEARDNNTRAEGHRAGVAEGKTAGLEIAGKTIAKKFNIDATLVNVKDLDKVVEAVSTSISKGDPGLQEQISLLQKDKETLIQEKTELVAKHKEMQFDSELIRNFPTNRSTLLSESEYLSVVKANLKFETDESGKMVVKKDGEIIRNGVTKNPVSVNEAISSFFTERKWVDNSGPGSGRGAGDNTGGNTGATGIKKMSEAVAAWKKDNPNGNETSPECHAYINDIAKSTQNFDYYN